MILHIQLRHLYRQPIPLPMKTHQNKSKWSTLHGNHTYAIGGQQRSVYTEINRLPANTNKLIQIQKREAIDHIYR